MPACACRTLELAAIAVLPAAQTAHGPGCGHAQAGSNTRGSKDGSGPRQALM